MCFKTSIVTPSSNAATPITSSYIAKNNLTRPLACCESLALFRFCRSSRVAPEMSNLLNITVGTLLEHFNINYYLYLKWDGHEQVHIYCRYKIRKHFSGDLSLTIFKFGANILPHVIYIGVIEKRRYQTVGNPFQIGQILSFTDASCVINSYNFEKIYIHIYIEHKLKLTPSIIPVVSHI